MVILNGPLRHNLCYAPADLETTFSMVAIVVTDLRCISRTQFVSVQSGLCLEEDINIHKP